ncbi:MAG: hypothetical protein Q7J25_11370 [Vicinamibacterales bacterium]|nr:hypothetical protein [Vicinamibacterales bacterium]
MKQKQVGQLLAIVGPAYLSNLAEHQRQGAIDVLNTVHKAANTFNDERSATDADPNLTPEGRAASGAKVATSALAQLEAIETTTIKKLTDRATSLETALRAKAAYSPPTNPAERMAHEQQLRELRDQLRGLSAAERLNVYRSSTDPLVLAAIETAPQTLSANRGRLEPFIDPTEQAAAVLARAEAADPAAAQTLREVRSLAEVYRLAVGGVRREILDEVPGVAQDAAAIVTP